MFDFLTGEINQILNSDLKTKKAFLDALKKLQAEINKNSTEHVEINKRVVELLSSEEKNNIKKIKMGKNADCFMKNKRLRCPIFCKKI